MKKLSIALLYLLLPISLAAASVPARGEACPSTGACHLPRWVPAGLPTNAHLGWSVDLEGTTAVAGAPEENAVYVFQRNGGQWSQIQRIASPGGVGIQFGAALYLDGDELLVGAPLADVAGGGFPIGRAGVVYVYERVGLAWSLDDTLEFSFPTYDGRFGTSVTKEGDRIAVGSPSAWFTDEGAVVVFDRNGGTWSETAVLGAADAVGLGASVAIDGDHVLAGDQVNKTLGKAAGRVYAWEDNGASWSSEEILPAPGIGAYSFLGYSITAEDGWVAAGAYGNADGSVLLYRHDDAAGTYEYQTTLTPCEGGSDRFGWAVDMDGDRLAVGAMVQGWPGSPTGRAHVYRLETHPVESWELEVVLSPADGADGDAFGRGVGIDGDFVLVGASDANTTGSKSGAVYLTSLQGMNAPGGECPCDGIAVAEPYGTGKPGTHGVPSLDLLGAPVLGQATTIELSSSLPGAQPFLLWGVLPTVVPLDGGELYVANPVLAGLPPINGLGVTALGLSVPSNPALCGFELAFQAFFLDPGVAPGTLTAQSNGLLVTLGF